MKKKRILSAILATAIASQGFGTFFSVQAKANTMDAYQKAVEELADAMIAHESQVVIYQKAGDESGQGVVDIDDSNACQELFRQAIERVYEKDRYAIGVLGEKTPSRITVETDGSTRETKQTAYFEYTETKEAYETEKKQLKNRVRSIANQIKEQKEIDSDYERVLAAHDYIIYKTAYDQEYEESGHEYSAMAYGVFFEHRAICNGYALAMNLLLSELGISSIKVNSYQEKGGMGHSWNLVLVDGAWYHIDTTWDDPVPNRENFASYQFFLLNSNEISTLYQPIHYGWDPLPYDANSNQFSKFSRKNSYVQLYSYRDNKWYIQNNVSVKCYDNQGTLLGTYLTFGSLNSIDVGFQVTQIDENKTYIESDEVEKKDVSGSSLQESLNTSQISQKEQQKTTEIIQTDDPNVYYRINPDGSVVKVTKRVEIKTQQKNLTIGKKEKVQLHTQKKVKKWTSSNSKIISVNSKGKIIGKKTGMATITAFTEDGKSVTAKITVKNAPKKITVKKSSIVLKKKKSAKISIKLPQNTASYARFYKVKNAKIVSISADGSIKAKKKGTTYITVTTYNHKSAKVKVTVK